MNDIAYHKLTALASTPDAVEKAIQYLASHLGQFLKKRDKVLILFPDTPATVGRLMKEAVLRCDAEPQFLEEDHRWLTILKTARLQTRWVSSWVHRTTNRWLETIRSGLADVAAQVHGTIIQTRRYSTSSSVKESKERSIQKTSSLSV